jgi:hypothetical protein
VGEERRGGGWRRAKVTPKMKFELARLHPKHGELLLANIEYYIFLTWHGYLQYFSDDSSATCPEKGSTRWMEDAT